MNRKIVNSVETGSPQGERAVNATSKQGSQGSLPSPPGGGRWEGTKANLRTIIGAVLLASFIRVVLFEAFEIEGPSMEPTLLNGDRVVVAKFMYGLFLPFAHQASLRWGQPKAGDVVIVKSPADEIDIVKRVIGVPGDRIEMRNDVLYRNGKALSQLNIGPCLDADDRRINDYGRCEWNREDLGRGPYYTSHSVDSSPSILHGMKVPEGHVFILGDHRDRSNDSRFFGPVHIARVKGRALLVYWSSEQGVRWHRLGKAIH